MPLQDLVWTDVFAVAGQEHQRYSGPGSFRGRAAGGRGGATRKALGELTPHPVCLGDRPNPGQRSRSLPGCEPGQDGFAITPLSGCGGSAGRGHGRNRPAGRHDHLAVEQVSQMGPRLCYFALRGELC